MTARGSPVAAQSASQHNSILYPWNAPVVHVVKRIRMLIICYSGFHMDTPCNSHEQTWINNGLFLRVVYVRFLVRSAMMR